MKYNEDNNEHAKFMKSIQKTLNLSFKIQGEQVCIKIQDFINLPNKAGVSVLFSYREGGLFQKALNLHINNSSSNEMEYPYVSVITFYVLLPMELLSLENFSILTLLRVLMICMLLSFNTYLDFYSKWINNMG